MAGINTDPEVEPKNPIDREFEIHADSVIALNCVIGEIEEHLYEVLKPAEQPMDEPSPGERTFQTPLEKTINDCNRDLKKINDRLRCLLDRIGLGIVPF